MVDNKLLTYFRTIGDEPIDLLVEKLVENEGLAYLRLLMTFLTDYQSFNFDDKPQILKDFLAENSNFPSFYNKKQIIRATNFYRENQQNIGLVLALYALPYCYLGADGAKVLYFSERIKNDTFNRLKETGSFLKLVMTYDNWEEDKIFAICFKIRLLHAVIRFYTLQSGRWNLAWGYPINQEDMLGTNLAFSLIVIRGLAKIGIKTDESTENAYLETWNVIGNLLGINRELLPQNIRENVKIDKLISIRQFRQSTEGEALTASLIKVIKGFAPNELTGNLLVEQSRFLLGDKFAKLLNITETNIPKSVLKIYTTTSTLFNKVF